MDTYMGTPQTDGYLSNYGSQIDSLPGAGITNITNFQTEEDSNDQENISRMSVADKRKFNKNKSYHKKGVNQASQPYCGSNSAKCTIF